MYASATPRSARFLRAFFIGSFSLCATVLLGGLAAPACHAQGDERDQIVYRGAADLRYRNTNKERTGSYIAATRFQADWTRHDPDTSVVRSGARVQLLLETDGRGTAMNHLRTSEVYGFHNFVLPGVSGQIRAGQFVLPFGLTAVYETALQPIQPLYDKALGLRVDTGVAVEGEYGPYRYVGAITTGSGPNRLQFGANVLTFRLSRAVYTELGTFEVGGSLLSGRGPVTTFDTELPASGTSRIRRYVNKSRIAGDGQYFFGPVTLRGELVFGGDEDNPVWGYFAEGNYQTTPRLTLVAMRKRWNFARKPEAASTTGLGANYDFGNGFTLRALYEFQRDVPFPAGTPPVVDKRLTLQTRLNF